MSAPLSLWGRVQSIARTVRSSPHPWRLGAALALKRSGLCRYFVIERGDYRLHFYPTSISATMWAEAGARSEDEQVVRSVLHDGDVMVDVGANIGALTLAACAEVGPHGHVVAIEAHPRTFQWLKGNLALNGMEATRVTALHLAVGAEAGAIAFSDSGDDDENHVDLAGAGRVVHVPMQSLDALLGDYPAIALLKIDVEGYEYAVLQGASETLRRTRCVFFEYSDALYSRYGYTGDTVLGALQEAGFSVWRLAAGERFPLAQGDTLAGTVNLLALREE